VISDQEKIFLIGLEELTRKTGVIIGGCGCCGSPFLTNAEYNKLDSRAGYAHGSPSLPDVAWVSPADAYEWERSQEYLIKARITKPLDNIRALDYMLKEKLSSYQCSPNDPFPGNHHYYSLLKHCDRIGYRGAEFIVAHNTNPLNEEGTKSPPNAVVLRILTIPSTHPELPQP
jgi:hypothetical protein